MGNAHVNPRPGASVSASVHGARRWYGTAVAQGRALPGKVEAISCSPGVNVLSVDLEPWVGRPCIDETRYLLDLFRAKGATATFFVLGVVASRYPALVKQVAAEGHEIASHGWNHDPICEKTPARFREEMKRSFGTLSSMVGAPIAGFRAPHFGVCPETYWALDVLADLGFRYDSSIFPFAGPRYGVPTFPRGPVRVTRHGRSLLEIPLSTVRAFGRNLPVAGGGYFRLLPMALIARAIKAVNADGLPFVAYCHPYDFQAEPLRIPRVPGPLGRAKTVVCEAKWNLFRRSLRKKLPRVLDGSPFTSIQEAFEFALTPPETPTGTPRDRASVATGSLPQAQCVSPRSGVPR